MAGPAEENMQYHLVLLQNFCFDTIKLLHHPHNDNTWRRPRLECETMLVRRMAKVLVARSYANMNVLATGSGEIFSTN